MSRAHAHDLFRPVSQGIWKSLFPVVSVAGNGLMQAEDGSFDPESTLVVQGSILRANKLQQKSEFLDLDKRWCTLTIAQVQEMYNTAKADGTIRSMRMVSRIAGNQYGVGSEPALALSLVGPNPAVAATLTKDELKARNEAATALAAKYGINYSKTVVVGPNQDINVTNQNVLILSMQAASIITGELYFPSIEKETQIQNRMDTQNPNLIQALAHYDATGQLPPRETNTSRRFDTEFAAEFAQTPASNQQNGRYTRRGASSDFV